MRDLTGGFFEPEPPPPLPVATDPVPPPDRWKPHQLDCEAAIRAGLAEGIRRQLIVMSVGLGKGWLMARLPERLDLWPMLVLVDGVDLVDQLAAYCRAAHPGAIVGVERADLEAPPDSDIVIASVATIGRKSGRAPARLRKWKPKHFRLVQADECHHSLAATHLTALRYFEPDLLTGWTGTPYRSDGKTLARVFDAVIFERDQEWGQDNAHLCPMRAERIKSTADLRNVHVNAAGEFTAESLGPVLNTDWVNSEIVSGIEDHAFSGARHTPRRHVIVFALDHNQVHSLVHQLTQRGHAAAEIIDSTPRHTRHERIAAFKCGELRLLVTCAALQEGFDAPMTDCIAHAVPTRSLLRYTQRNGRGIRVHPAKDYCLVLDFVGVCGQFRPITATEAFGVRDVDCLGGDVLDTARKVRKAAEEGVTVSDGDTIEDVIRRMQAIERIAMQTVRVDTTATAVDLYAATAVSPTVQRSSVFPWVQLSDSRYVLRVGKAVASLARDPRGAWWLYLHDHKEYVTSSDRPLREADRSIKKRVDKWRMMRLNAGWKRQRPTGKQLARLQQLGWDVIPPDLTSGGASHLIDTIALQKRLAKLDLVRELKQGGKR